MTGILIAEDEPRIASFVSKGLRSAGYATMTVGDGLSALQVALTADVDLVILDIGLPDMDGYEVLRRLRAQGSQVPVIVLTARTSVDDTIASLEGGADDYMPKPFRFEELLARVRLRLRAPAATSEPAASHELNAGDVRLDLHTRQLHVDGIAHDLSAREFSLAETFVRHPRQVLSREQLLSRVWGYDFDPDSNVVDVYVGYLRKKLGSERIVTVRGMGYRLDV
ncbi:MAG: response regulator transcription factor [Dermatophilus congolensis]|nr:response regulator transcription factor [Dermatophilus congolensis]